MSVIAEFHTDSYHTGGYRTGAPSFCEYGRKLSGHMRARGQVELAHRLQIAWMRFHKHRDILLDQNINIRSRLRFFQSVISTTVMYGLPACALTKKLVESLDVVQRKMLRKMVGWSRIDGEYWSDTMRRMREKVQGALRLHHVEDWSRQFLRRQFRMICRLQKQDNEWAMQVSRWSPAETNSAAHRARGRPLARWDDRLNAFTLSQFETDSWQEACASPFFHRYEDSYVMFHSNAG